VDFLLLSTPTMLRPLPKQHAAKALVDILSGSGGLELGIGGCKVVLPSKRGSTMPGLVEVQLLLNINKKLVSMNTDEIPKMRDIPSRPFLADDCMEVGNREAHASDHDCTDLFEETQSACLIMKFVFKFHCCHCDSVCMIHSVNSVNRANGMTSTDWSAKSPNPVLECSGHPEIALWNSQNSVCGRNAKCSMPIGQV